MSKPFRIGLFIAMIIGVGWLDIFFFDRDTPLQFLWFILSGAALIGVANWMYRKRSD